jgi:hypothetical protein
MKRLILFAAIVALTLPVAAQETADATMEKRAREMHRVIGVDDKEQWKTFMRENYTQALIDKPMKIVVDTSDGSSGSSGAQTIDKLDAKAAMYQRLHEDFGKSKLTSIKTTDGKVEMVVQNDDGVRATFILTFTKAKPYLIDGIGIEVQDEGQ